MIQSFEIWCDYCLKTKYYDDLKATKDEIFIKINNSILCKSCAENKKIEDWFFCDLFFIMEHENLKYSIKNHIVCNKCIKELSTLSTKDINLKNFVKFEVGFTSLGIQIWCIRHNINVCHIDFDDNQLSADFRCLEFDNSN